MLAGVLACTLVFPAFAEAQQTPPLAEVARKEAERRKGIKETQKVITTKDLPESARKPRPSPEAAPAAGGQPHRALIPRTVTSRRVTRSSRRVPQARWPTTRKTKKYWRTRIMQARESVRRNEAFAEALQSRINALTTDFVNRDDPFQRAKVGEDRQKALEELARVKTDIEQNRRQIEDVEEEARKAGVPPGWLR